MIPANTLFFGVDPASSNKDFSYAVLDDHLNLADLADADMQELLGVLDDQESVLVAINAPKNVNYGLVKKKLAAQSSDPDRALRKVDIRLAEYELRERGITVAGTPSREEYCPAWVQAGFALYQELTRLGFSMVGTKSSRRQFFETQPYACFCVMLDGIPLSKPSLEGRLQRQLILNDKGVQITDGMHFFEEITRFKLMKGVLPADVLYSSEHLDVLVAACTAWLVVHHPEEVTIIGDADEGQIVLPVRELRDRYDRSDL